MFLISCAREVVSSLCEWLSSLFMQEGHCPSAQKSNPCLISCVTIGGVKKSSLFKPRTLVRGETISRLFMTYALLVTEVDIVDILLPIIFYGIEQHPLQYIIK